MIPPRPWLLPPSDLSPGYGVWKAENTGSAEMVGAVAYQRAGDVVWSAKDEDDWGYWGGSTDEAVERLALTKAKAAILALAPAEPLAEVERLKEALREMG